ncbi:hypothetical protein FQA39_LY01281 [Lamprigera yunnana]|nr:hypothetical protein FQA39_LY01281 [Lamprigera yunnana]
MLVWFVCIVIGALFFHYYWKNRRLYKLASKIPGPKGYPIIGNAFMFISFKEIAQNLNKILIQYGSPMLVWIFNVPVVAITEPKHAQVVLNSALEKDSRYSFARELFGDGLLTAPVNVWKYHRKIINPAFNQKILDTFMHIFVNQSIVLIDQLSKEVDGGVFNVHRYISRCSLDIICETAMGVTVDAQTKPSKLLHEIRRAAQVLVERALRVWLHPQIIFNHTERGQKFKEAIDYVHDFTGNLVRQRREEFFSKKDAVFEDDSKKPFLEHLLGLSDQMTFLELRHEVDLFITAGSDTITTTTGYVLVCMGMYPDIQEEVAKELDEVFGKTNRPITKDDLSKLIYMEKVVKETMRIYPPVPVIARSITEDVDLDGIILPSGVSAAICIIGIHRDPETWPDPLKFDPTRFDAEEVAKRHPYSFIPFSAGPRNCIGIKFAMMSMKVLLSTILRSYKVHTNIKPEDIKLSVEIVSKMIGGANIFITKR